MEFYNVISAVFILLDLVLLGTFVYVFVRALEHRPQFSIRSRSPKKTLTLRNAVFRERWEDIAKKFNTGSPDSIRLAIIEADKLSDDALKQMGLKGEHMADRLERLSQQDLKSLEKLWRAHRLRNDLVHSPGFEVSASQAERALGDYQAFLSEIGVLTEQ